MNPVPPHCVARGWDGGRERHAKQMGADAVIGMRYDATESTRSATEVLAYGTAVTSTRLAEDQGATLDGAPGRLPFLLTFGVSVLLTVSATPALA